MRFPMHFSSFVLLFALLAGARGQQFSVPLSSKKTIEPADQQRARDWLRPLDHEADPVSNLAEWPASLRPWLMFALAEAGDPVKARQCRSARGTLEESLLLAALNAKHERPFAALKHVTNSKRSGHQAEALVLSGLLQFLPPNQIDLLPVLEPSFLRLMPGDRLSSAQLGMSEAWGRYLVRESRPELARRSLEKAVQARHNPDRIRMLQRLCQEQLVNRNPTAVRALSTGMPEQAKRKLLATQAMLFARDGNNQGVDNMLTALEKDTELTVKALHGILRTVARRQGYASAKPYLIHLQALDARRNTRYRQTTVEELAWGAHWDDLDDLQAKMSRQDLGQVQAITLQRELAYHQEFPKGLTRSGQQQLLPQTSLLSIDRIPWPKRHLSALSTVDLIECLKRDGTDPAYEQAVFRLEKTVHQAREADWEELATAHLILARAFELKNDAARQALALAAAEEACLNAGYENTGEIPALLGLLVRSGKSEAAKRVIQQVNRTLETKHQEGFSPALCAQFAHALGLVDDTESMRTFLAEYRTGVFRRAILVGGALGLLKIEHPLAGLYQPEISYIVD